jgi:hypothetical protein
MRYYIIKFKNNENGDKFRYELGGAPNGTPFGNNPIYINWCNDFDREDKFEIIYTRCDDEYVDNFCNLIDNETCEFIKTNIVNELDIDLIIKGLNQEHNISRDNEIINNFILNVFKDYI